MAAVTYSLAVDFFFYICEITYKKYFVLIERCIHTQ